MNIDELIIELEKLPKENKIEACRRLKAWCNKTESEIGNNEAMIDAICDCYSLCKLQGKVTTTKLASAMGYRSAQQKMQLMQFIQDNRFMMDISNKGEILKVFRNPVLNPRNPEYKIMVFNKLYNVVYVMTYEYPNITVLGVMYNYMSLVNHPIKIADILSKIPHRDSIACNPVDTYDFESKKFSGRHREVHEVNPEDIVKLGFTVLVTNTRGSFNKLYNIGVLNKLIEEMHGSL